MSVGRISRAWPRYSIRMSRKGCKNRPFFILYVTDSEIPWSLTKPVEQVGVYDPLANIHNEKLVSLNFDRIRYWLGEGARFTPPVGELLGLCGFLPLHPNTIMRSWEVRRVLEKEQMENQQATESGSAEEETKAVEQNT